MYNPLRYESPNRRAVRSMMEAQAQMNRENHQFFRMIRKLVFRIGCLVFALALGLAIAFGCIIGHIFN